jgi:hypothetical protein
MPAETQVPKYWGDGRADRAPEKDECGWAGETSRRAPADVAVQTPVRRCALPPYESRSPAFNLFNVIGHSQISPFQHAPEPGNEAVLYRTTNLCNYM